MGINVLPPQARDRGDSDDEIFAVLQGLQQVIQVIIVKHLEPAMNATVCRHWIEIRG